MEPAVRIEPGPRLRSDALRDPSGSMVNRLPVQFPTPRRQSRRPLPQKEDVVDQRSYVHATLDDTLA